MAKLKVYVTPIGFHDAYVAAPSQKAALAAWGTAHDLFARGVASVVDDPASMEEALAQPGKVIKRLRGTTAEQLAALPPNKSGRGAGKVRAANAAAPGTASLPKARPLPSRAELDAAEARLGAARDAQAAVRAGLERELAELRHRIDTIRQDHARELERLDRMRLTAERHYREAVRRHLDADDDAKG